MYQCEVRFQHVQKYSPDAHMHEYEQL